MTQTDHVHLRRHQKQQDGELVASGLPMVGSTGVVEALADALINELLSEQAQGEPPAGVLHSCRNNDSEEVLLLLVCRPGKDVRLHRR